MENWCKELCGGNGGEWLERMGIYWEQTQNREGGLSIYLSLYIRNEGGKGVGRGGD
jgi:hypothetical protein